MNRGCEYVFTSGVNRSNHAIVLARKHMVRLNKEACRHVCYEFPMGGASPVRSVGFIEGYVEPEEQLSRIGIRADYVFHATGTGGTMARLAAGRNLVGSDTEIISINVSAKSPEYPERTAALANESLKLIWAGSNVVFWHTGGATV